MSSEAARPPALTTLTDDETLFRDTVREFARSEIAPLAAEMDRTGRYADGILGRLFEMGLLGIEVPEAFGGAGASFFESILAVEEVSYADAAVGVLVDVQNTLFNTGLLRYGTEEQKRSFLGRTSTDTVAAYALSETGSGSDAFALAARATPEGPGFVLDGQKMWITNAAEAGVFLIFATVDPSLGYRGITAFLVERSDPGFSVGKRESKLGIRASSTCELVLDGCVVGPERVLGQVGKGYKVAIELLNEGRIGIGAQMLGVAGRALDLALGYTRERRQFGRPISEFQAVQHQVAECATHLEAARLLVYNAARLRDSGRPFLREAAMAKLYSSEVAEEVTSAAVELYGGYGYTTEYPVEKLYRDAKIGKIYEGTSFLQRNTIAKSLLEGR